MLTARSRSGVRGKDAGIVGQAGWASSVVNLVNTSAPSPPSSPHLLRSSRLGC